MGTEVTQEAVLHELAAIAFARVTDYLSVRDGVLEIRTVDSLLPGGAAAVASVEKTSTGLKLKFYDKLRALELLGKCTGLFDGVSAPEPRENGLLQAILQSTGGEVTTDDLPELQQAAAAGTILVEPAGNEAI